MKKRLLSILTTLALCLTLLPTAVWAASTPENLTFDISEGPVTITDGTTAGTIQVEYGAGQSTGDIDPSNTITVTGRTVNENRGLVIKTTTPRQTSSTSTTQESNLRTPCRWTISALRPR